MLVESYSELTTLGLRLLWYRSPPLTQSQRTRMSPICGALRTANQDTSRHIDRTAVCSSSTTLVHRCRIHHQLPRMAHQFIAVVSIISCPAWLIALCSRSAIASPQSFGPCDRLLIVQSCAVCPISHQLLDRRYCSS